MSYKIKIKTIYIKKNVIPFFSKANKVSPSGYVDGSACTMKVKEENKLDSVPGTDDTLKSILLANST